MGTKDRCRYGSLFSKVREKLQQIGQKLPRVVLFAIMLLALASFGSGDVKLDNLGDLNVDIGFQIALPYFLEQHLQYGEQVVFTYGPWGILLSRFTGSTYHEVALLFRITLTICIFLALCVLVDRSTGRAGRIVAWGGALALVLLWITGHRDSYFLFPALLVAFQRLSAAVAEDGRTALPIQRAESLLWIAMSLLSGWAALAKFNIFVVSSVAYVLILVDDVKCRRWPMLPFAFAAALLLAWYVAGQNFANLLLWVLRSLDLSYGYADAMAKGFFVPYSAGLVAVYYLAVALIILAALAAAALHHWKFPVLLLLLLISFVSAVAVKHGIGGNQIENSLAELVTTLWFVTLLLVFPPVRSVEQNGYRWDRFGLVTALVASFGLAVVASGANFPIHSPKRTLTNMLDNAALLTQTLRGEPTDRLDEVLVQSHRFWLPQTVPDGQTIDVYPHQTGVVIGRDGLVYSPRPAFLSLNAHTSALALLNAQHLEGNTAPDIILFQVLPRERSVNNRHPALADGPSWPLLLSRYALENTSDEFLLLKKRQQPLPIDRKLLFEIDLQMGEAVAIPQGSGNLIWAEIDIERSFIGSIIHILYKSPHVLLESRMVGNSTHTAQIVPELGKAGFLISPLVQNNAAFTELYRDDGMSGNIVQTITISSPEAPDNFWERSFKLRLYVLNIGDRSL